MARQDISGREQGFSLVELVIAMVVTMLISGAVFQLMTASQTAFRKEPAVADRQQNIRVAMDLIAQDVYRAGHGLPQFAQAFTDGLDGVGPPGPGGSDADELGVFAAAECPALQVCESSGVQLKTWASLTPCYRFPALVILGDASCWGMRFAEKPGAGKASSCGGGGSANGHVTFPPGKAIVNPPGGFTSWEPEWMLVGDAVRYRINIDAEGTPNLERSAFGGQVIPGPGGGTNSWEIIARGVEDLQVEYMNTTGWHDQPGAISCASANATCGNTCQAVATDYDTLISRVRVRLSARAMEANLTGQSTSAIGNAVRGQLVTEVAPRAATATIAMFRGEL